MDVVGAKPTNPFLEFSTLHPRNGQVFGQWMAKCVLDNLGQQINLRRLKKIKRSGTGDGMGPF